MSLIIGKYDLSELDEVSQEFWRKYAESGDLPELPSKSEDDKESNIKIFFKRYDTGLIDFPNQKAHAVLTSDGKIYRLSDFFEKLLKMQIMTVINKD